MDKKGLGLETLVKAEEFSNKKLAEIRNVLETELQGDDFCIAIGGSFARREASEESDLDYFLIKDGESASCDGDRTNASIGAALEKIVKKPSKDGAFAQQANPIGELTRNIGGDEDSNQKITRRVLLLIEGEWIYNRKKFDEYRDAIVTRYISNEISDHQIARFLLNDLIRYYRTVCVDFEYKTAELDKGWGLRNLKLKFSRKLLYFSSLLLVAQTLQRSPQRKREAVEDLIKLTPIERIWKTCGPHAREVLQRYESFLESISNPEFRERIEKVTMDRSSQSSEFRNLKDDGHHFSWSLYKLLRDTYDVTHPIHEALVF